MRNSNSNSYSTSYYDLYPTKKVDLAKEVKDLEAEFCNDTCEHCGKEFFKTYFVICADCLTEMDERNKK